MVSQKTRRTEKACLRVDVPQVLPRDRVHADVKVGYAQADAEAVADPVCG